MEEWREVLERAGFVVEVARRRDLDWDFHGWMSNMAVPPDREEELARTIEAAPAAVLQELRPRRRDGRLWHTYWHALIRARRPAA